MSEKLSEKMPDATEDTPVIESSVQTSAAAESQEPKNVQELTNYIQSMLQQIQDRFQTMSDQDFTLVIQLVLLNQIQKK
jgi:heat shock factor-binding protein 1